MNSSMRRRIGFSALGLIFALASPAIAVEKVKSGFVKLANGRELYIDYIKPEPTKPIVVLLNGLTYSTVTWQPFVTSLKSEGLGILRYDPMGMGRTLLKYGAPIDAIDYRDQVADLAQLLDALGIKQRVHVVGLSYGGALALQFGHEYPERVSSLIIMAPFVAPLETQDNWIKMQVQQTRLLQPWNTASYDELYDYYLRANIMTTYPLAEPIVLENPFKLEATFRMVQGIRKFLAKDVSKFKPNVAVHMMVGRRDQYIDNSVHEEFWKLLQDGTRTSFLYIEEVEHKIPEVAPRFSAAWVRNAVNANPKICCGRTYTASPWTQKVTSGSDTFVVE